MKGNINYVCIIVFFIFNLSISSLTFRRRKAYLVEKKINGVFFIDSRYKVLFQFCVNDIKSISVSSVVEGETERGMSEKKKKEKKIEVVNFRLNTDWRVIF